MIKWVFNHKIAQLMQLKQFFCVLWLTQIFFVVIYHTSSRLLELKAFFSLVWSASAMRWAIIISFMIFLWKEFHLLITNEKMDLNCAGRQIKEIKLIYWFLSTFDLLVFSHGNRQIRQNTAEIKINNADKWCQQYKWHYSEFIKIDGNSHSYNFNNQDLWLTVKVIFDD